MSGLASARRAKERRQARVVASAVDEAFQRLQSRLSYVESVACAFAFDLSVRTAEAARHCHSDPAANAYGDTLEGAQEAWASALRSLGEQHGQE